MGFLKSVKKIGTKAVKSTKKIGNSVANEAKNIGSKVSSVAKSSKKDITKAASIFNTSLGKAATIIGKSTGVQPLTEIGRGYKAIGRAGKNDLKHKHKSKAKNFRKLEKHVIKGSAQVAAMFA